MYTFVNITRKDKNLIWLLNSRRKIRRCFCPSVTAERVFKNSARSSLVGIPSSDVINSKPVFIGTTTTRRRQGPIVTVDENYWDKLTSKNQALLFIIQNVLNTFYFQTLVLYSDDPLKYCNDELLQNLNFVTFLNRFGVTCSK